MLHMFNPFDPVGSWLRGLIDNTIDSIVKLFSDAMNMIISMSSFSFTDSWFLRMYTYTFTVAFLVGLPLLLIMTFVKTASGSISPSEMWTTLGVRVPKFIVLCMFGPAIGGMLGVLIAGLDKSIIEFSFGGTADEMSTTFTNSLVSSFAGNPGGLIMSLLLALLILIAIIVFFITSMLLFVLTIAVAVFFPLAQLFDLTTSRRGITRKYLTVVMFMLALMPISLLLFGLFMQMMASNVDAGTIVGVVQNEAEGSSIRQIALLLISAIALLIPALGPIALLKFSTAFSGSGGGGKGGGGGGGSTAILGGGGAQGAAKGAAIGAAAGGVGAIPGAAAGAAGGGGAAAAGAASSGAGATASGAARAGGSAAASKGSSTGAQKASAAGRIAESTRANHQRRTQSTAQAAAMASYQLDGVPERGDDD